MDTRQPLWQALRERLAALSDCGFYATKKYVGLKKGSKTVCFIHPQKDRIRLDILRGKKSKEGKSSKGFFSLDDPKGIASEHGWTWANGETGHSYRIPVNKQNDLDYLIFLVTQKHESL